MIPWGLLGARKKNDVAIDTLAFVYGENLSDTKGFEVVTQEVLLVEEGRDNCDRFWVNFAKSQVLDDDRTKGCF